MNLLAEIGLPFVIVLSMTIVGLELVPDDLKRVLQYPSHVAVALSAQVLVLPVIAAGLIVLLEPQPAVAGGLILVAAAPQAIVSNYFCLLARADVALAVTLTAVSSLLALATTPLVASLSFDLLLEQRAGFVLPAAKVMQQVALGLLLPIAAGMLIRHLAPGFVVRNRGRLQRLSLAALAVLLVTVLANEAGTILRSLGSIVGMAVLFTTGAIGLALVIAKGFSFPRQDSVTLMAAFPARSLSIATLVAVNVLGRLDFLSFAAVFFIVQAVLIVPLMLFMRAPAAS